MQLGLFGLDESDAHGQQLPAPRAQGSDAAGGQLAASNSADAVDGRSAWARILKLTQPDRETFYRFLRERDAAFAQGSKLLQLLNEWHSNRETAVTA